MGDFDPSFVHALATQSWSLYGFGMFLILLRMYASPSRLPISSSATDCSCRYARIHRLGIKGLQTDDYLMMLAGVNLSSHLPAEILTRFLVSVHNPNCMPQRHFRRRR